uniref:Uncharacterized protein n=1 Tax=Rhipicephalus pulchellus TaxID=72859 RepID=L7LUY9_RHIPC
MTMLCIALFPSLSSFQFSILSRLSSLLFHSLALVYNAWLCYPLPSPLLLSPPHLHTTLSHPLHYSSLCYARSCLAYTCWASYGHHGHFSDVLTTPL